MLHMDPTSGLYHTDSSTLIGVPGLILMPTGLNFAMSVVISSLELENQNGSIVTSK